MFIIYFIYQLRLYIILLLCIFFFFFTAATQMRYFSAGHRVVPYTILYIIITFPRIELYTVDHRTNEVRQAVVEYKRRANRRHFTDYTAAAERL